MDGPVNAWFGLTYANYLVIPRSLLQGMPMAWQNRFVQCLNEMGSTYDSNQIEDDYMVKLRGNNGKFKHDRLGEYRHPEPLPYINDTGIGGEDEPIR